MPRGRALGSPRGAAVRHPCKAAAPPQGVRRVHGEPLVGVLDPAVEEGKCPPVVAAILRLFNGGRRVLAPSFLSWLCLLVLLTHVRGLFDEN